MKIPGSLSKIWLVWLRVSMVIIATILLTVTIMVTSVSDYWVYVLLPIMLISTYTGLRKMLTLFDEFITEEFGEDK